MQRKEEKVPVEHKFEVVSCGNVLYVRKGFVDEHTTIASLTDDSTGQEYQLNNTMYVYGDSWYCFELKDSILAGRAFSGVFIVGGEEYAFNGKVVNSPPSSDGTEEKKSSSRLMSLIPTVVIAVLVIVFAIMAWRSEPSDPNGEPEPPRQESASPEVQNKNDLKSVNVNTTPTEKEPANATSVVNNDNHVLKDESESDSDNRLGDNSGDTGKEQHIAFEEQPKASPFVMDNPPKTTGKQDDAKSDVSTSVASAPQPSGNGMENVKVTEKTEIKTGSDGKGRQGNHVAQGNGKETNHETVQIAAPPKSASIARKEPQRVALIDTPAKETRQGPPPNTNIQSVKSVKRPGYSPLTEQQAKLRDNGTYSITNDIDIKNLNSIADSGCKNIVLVFCPDRYGRITPQAYSSQWMSLTGQVNDMLEGTIKKVQVIKPQRLDLEVPDRASLNKGIAFDVVELR